MTDTPKIAQKAPYPVAVTAGRTYFWCTCGRSAKQPFCDGSHKETSLEPMKYQAEADKTLTSNSTGTHNGFFYSYWKDNGNVTMTLGSAGS